MSYQSKLNDYVSKGFSSEYIVSSLWASYSSSHSILKIQQDVDEALK